MSCTTCTSATSAPIVVPAPKCSRPEWPPVIKTIIMLHEAFREALEMRRAAHKKYRFIEE
jgi:hypothetical protein